MDAPQLGIDSEDLGFDILPAIERSFGIKFEDSDFHKHFTYGELHALVLARLPQMPVNDCTTQQAFYKLRQALRPHIGEVRIWPDSRLANLLPANPRQVASAVQAELGMELGLVGMPAWAGWSGAGLVLLALVLFFLNWQLALSLLGLTVMGLHIASRLGRTLRFETVRQVVERMSTRHYQQARRHSDTVNLLEIKARLDYLFIDMAGLEAEQLVPEAVL